MAVWDLRNSFGANGDTNRQTLIDVNAAASNGDEVWLPRAGAYPLKLDATTGLVVTFTKSLRLRGSGLSPSAGYFVIEVPAGPLTPAFANSITIARNTNNFIWENFGIDGQYAISSDSKAVQGLTFLLGTGYQAIAPYIVNFRSHMMSCQGATIDIYDAELDSSDTGISTGGNHHGLDCDEDPATNGPHLVRVYRGRLRNRIGQAFKSEKGKVEFYGVDVDGAVAFGNNDSGDTTPFGNHILQGNTFRGPIVIGDTASSPGTCVGAYATIRGNRFTESGIVLIEGTAALNSRYGYLGANECVIEGNRFEGANSVVENLTGTTAANGEIYRNPNFAGRNLGVRGVVTRYARATAISANEYTGLSAGTYLTPQGASTSITLADNARNATDELLVQAGTYTSALTGQFPSFTSAGVRRFADGVIFDGRDLGDVSRCMSMAPTSGTITTYGRPTIKNFASTTTFAGGLDVNPSAGATVAVDGFIFQNIYRNGAAHYAAALRSRGAGAFSYRYLEASACKNGNTTNSGDGHVFAFENTGGFYPGVTVLLDNEDRGTDARAGFISVKTGTTNAPVIPALAALRNVRNGGVSKGLVYSTVTTAAGGLTIQQMTSKGNTGAASSVNCMYCANSCTITVNNSVVAADSRGNEALSASGAIVFSGSNLYQTSTGGEARVTYTAGILLSDPLLDSNGKPLAGSPVIDAGSRWWSDWQVDAAGYLWPAGKASLGAYRATFNGSGFVGAA